MKNIKINACLEYTNKTSKKTKEAGERLDVFLTNYFPNLSRSKIQKKIKDKEILVNKKEISVHYKLRGGDSVSFGNKKSVEDVKLKEKKAEKSNELFKKIKIIKKTSEYLVIYKPAGLIVHGADHIKERTLADWLIDKYPKIKKIGDDSFRPGIVHRLDKEVSGLMVVALTSKSFENLKKQFIKREIKKEYTALVYGKIDKDYGILDFSIRRSSDGHKMAAIPYKFGENLNITNSFSRGKARRAITEFEIIEKFINYTLLKVKIKTGRTHQIRVHMFAFNHSIVGDNLYSTKKTREKNIKVDLNRVFLQATKLCFKDLKEKERCFKTELDEKLKDYLKIVK